MNHLNLNKRYKIIALKESGVKQKTIADLLNVHGSTISRELKRNAGLHGYSAEEANAIAICRRKKCGNGKVKMTASLIEVIEKKLKEDQWSPEQISGWLQKENGLKISHERIYQYIWKEKKEKGRLFLNLRRRGRVYKKRGLIYAGRGLIPGRIDIDQRPMIVDEKTRIGDFEIDTIVGAKHKGSILSIVDRKTKLTKLVLLKRATAQAICNALLKALHPIRSLIKTITSDNGKEFAFHKIVSRFLNVNFYFAKPHSPWQRGLNENTNGLVRQYFPKGFDFCKITEKDVFEVENKLNNRPRKTLNFITPNKFFFELTGFDSSIAFHT